MDKNFELIKNIIKKAFSFSGRSNRKEYFIFKILYICLNILLIIPLYWKSFYFLIFIHPVLFVSNLAITVRRLHDFNVSWWSYFFLNLLFIVIMIYLMVKDGSIKREVVMSTQTSIFVYLVCISEYLIFFFFKGTPGPNKYGEESIN